MVETLREAIDRVQALPRPSYRDKLTHTFGVVVESDSPRQTKGSDLIQTVKLVDESCPAAVDLCIFCPRIDQMPRPQPGDILELRFVCVQFYQERPQLFGKMGPPHAFGFLLYRPAAGQGGGSSSSSSSAPPHPIQLYNTGVDGTHVAQRLPQLLPLQQQVLGQPPCQEPGAVYLRRIIDLAPPDQEGQRPLCVDMRVKVLAIDQRPHAQDEVVMFVWDGTDARPIPANLHMPPSEWKGTELALPSPRRRSLPLVAQPPGLLVLQELPPLGTALPVVVQPGALTVLPSVGDWVKIKVVGLAAVQGQWQAVFGKCSRLTQSQPAAGFEAAYNTRLANQDTSEWSLELERVATTCRLTALPRLTIRQVLQRAAAKQPGPFKVQLRLIGYLPSQLRDWCRREEPACGGGGAWEWAAHLLLEDATGELRALLLGEEATNVLGLPPHDLSHEDDVLQLQHALDYLSSVDDSGGVWMEVAITPVYPTEQQQQQQQQQERRQQQQEQEAQQQQQDQQQQPDQQQEQGGQGVAAAATLFVLHDAVCHAVEQQRQQQAEPGPQQQQQQQQVQHEAPGLQRASPPRSPATTPGASQQQDSSQKRRRRAAA